MKQLIITPAAGKRLIGKGIAAHPAVRGALVKGRLVIVAGTTNGYVAEEVLESVGQREGFDRMGFRRGMVTPPAFDASSVKARLEGDVVLVDGKWDRGRQIFDVIDDLQAGDVICKGANAVNLCTRSAGVYIEHPRSGTIGAAIPAVAGRRVRLIIPVGLEKRITADIAELAGKLNSPEAAGPRMMPMPGEVFTELDAIELLSGAKASLVAAGGIYGAEGCVYVAVEGTDEQVRAADELIRSIAEEPPCRA